MTEWTKTFQSENKNKIRNVFHRNNELEHKLQDNRKQIYMN